jgi:NAD(P)-dependent dehydrogenase (short-subunit alcohol dehydrogenase family)
MTPAPGEPGSVSLALEGVVVANLSGKTALVTGASRGIGRAIALALASAGVRVALTSRHAASVEEVAGECGSGSLPITLETSDEQSCTDAIRSAEKEFGHLDILVNNAGIAESSKFTDIDTAMWHRTLAVDLDGPFWLTRAALPGMLSRSKGTVISIGSVASRVGLSYAVAYTVAKHGLLGLTRSLAAEYARSGLTFNCICPHYVDTPMTDATIENIALRTGRTRAQARQALLTPQGSLIEPNDVAALVVFLASDVGMSITGQAIQIDGGQVQS